MRTLKSILAEKKGEEEQKVVFIETDPNVAFPPDTISALERDIHKKAKDLERNWRTAFELVDASFTDLDVPKPLVHQKERWEQYERLLKVAMRRLFESRGEKGGWSNLT